MTVALRNLRAIFVRELAGYFLSPTAYVVLFFFLLTNGITFYVYASWFRTDPRQIDVVIQYLFGWLPFWILFLLMPPILTMRLFAEEKRTGTIETLMTAPVTDFQVVMGKFLAAETFFAVIWSTVLVFIAILGVLGNPDWGPVFAFYVGVLSLGALFTAIGLLSSAFTRNQLIAAIVAMSVNLFLFFLNQCRAIFRGDAAAQEFFDFISFYHHFFNDYSRGLVDIRYVVLYLSFTGFVLYFAVKVVSWRRGR